MKIITKTELMNGVAAGALRECFEHSEQGTFDITALRTLLQNRALPVESWEVPLREINPFVRVHRVVEQARVDALPQESWENDPGIFVIINEPQGGVSHLMIDGHHRAIRREQEGRLTMHFYFVELRFACRPSANWVKNPYFDWGDELIDGKIVKRSA